jgi:hypothetical protein
LGYPETHDTLNVLKILCSGYSKCERLYIPSAAVNALDPDMNISMFRGPPARRKISKH